MGGHVKFHHYHKVYEHLIMNGFDPTYKTWVFHGESPPEYVEHEDVERPEEYRMFNDAVFDDDMDDEGHDAEEPPVKKGETDFENKQKFDVDECRKEYIFGKMGKRSDLVREVKKQGKTIGLNRAITLLKPDNVYSIDKWKAFIKKRSIAEYEARCEKFKKMRASQTLPHTTSRKGYARLEEEMEKVKKLIEEAPEDQNSINDDAISKVIGPERRGRIRGLGFDATKTKVQCSNFNLDKVSKLESQMKEMNERMNQLDEILRNKQNGSTCVQGSQNSGQLPTQLNVAPTPECGSNPSGVEGRKCELLDWLTEKVVGKGEIASIDPTSCVHHVSIGKGCWKVWVQEVFDDSVSCYRPTREFFLLYEALSSTLAWLIEYIRVIES